MLPRVARCCFVLHRGAAPGSTGGSSSFSQERAAVTPSPSTVPASAPPAASTASFMSSQYSAQPAQPLHNNSSSHSSFLSSGPAVATQQPAPLTSNSGYAVPAASFAASVPVAAASSTAGAAAAAAVRRPGAPSASGVQAFGQFSGFGRSAAPKYDLSADQAKLNDQCRDAIKNNDSAGVVALLGAGADAKYVDHTGNSLLHLAAMFDRFDIAKALLTSGASLTLKNPAGETPLDIAPPAMQHKLQALAAA